MKEQVDILDATPSKRLYLSIIADYDLCKAISELVWCPGNIFPQKRIEFYCLAMNYALSERQRI